MTFCKKETIKFNNQPTNNIVLQQVDNVAVLKCVWCVLEGGGRLCVDFKCLWASVSIWVYSLCSRFVQQSKNMTVQHCPRVCLIKKTSELIELCKKKPKLNKYFLRDICKVCVNISLFICGSFILDTHIQK